MCLAQRITHPGTGVCCVSSSILEAAGQVAAVLSRCQRTADHILPPPRCSYWQLSEKFTFYYFSRTEAHPLNKDTMSVCVCVCGSFKDEHV